MKSNNNLDAISTVNQVRSDVHVFTIKVTLLPLIIFGGLGLLFQYIFHHYLFLVAGLTIAFLATMLSIFVLTRKKRGQDMLKYE